MKFVKTNSGNVKITDDSDNLLAILPATTYIHLDPRYDTGLRLSSSANPDNEADTFRVNQANVTVPSSTDREDLAAQLEASFFSSADGISGSQTITKVAYNNSSTQLVAANSARREVIISNNTDVIVDVLVGSGTAVVNEEIPLAVNGSISFRTTSAIQFICRTATTGKVQSTELL